MTENDQSEFDRLQDKLDNIKRPDRTPDKVTVKTTTTRIWKAEGYTEIESIEELK